MANLSAARAYAALIKDAGLSTGVAPALIAGVLEHESRWNPRALRDEPAIGDASRGLGQLLLRTAQSLGFAGDPAGLFDPTVNIPLAAEYLAQQIALAGSTQGGVSAYNGGYRPDVGFGAPSPIAYTAVLARGADGKPTQTRAVAVGEFANQPYVDDVMTRARAFAASDVFDNPPPYDPTSSSGALVSAAAPLTALLDPIDRATASVPAWAKIGLGVAAAAAVLWPILRKKGIL